MHKAKTKQISEAFFFAASQADCMTTEGKQNLLLNLHKLFLEYCVRKNADRGIVSRMQLTKAMIASTIVKEQSLAFGQKMHKQFKQEWAAEIAERDARVAMQKDASSEAK